MTQFNTPRRSWLWIRMKTWGAVADALVHAEGLCDRLSTRAVGRYVRATREHRHAR